MARDRQVQVVVNMTQQSCMISSATQNPKLASMTLLYQLNTNQMLPPGFSAFVAIFIALNVVFVVVPVLILEF